MIRLRASGHEGAMDGAGLTLEDGSMATREGAAAEAAIAKRFRTLADTHYDFVWRSLRRLGVADGDVDDGAQRVFLTALRKVASIRVGSERSFLFQTALRVASDCRRARRRRPEVPAIEEAKDAAPIGEELLDMWRARQRLDRILDGMSIDLRAVFVLFELDEMTMAEIAVLLGVPAGTVASRLRRARAQFREKAAALPIASRLQGGRK